MSKIISLHGIDVYDTTGKCICHNEIWHSCPIIISEDEGEPVTKPKRRTLAQIDAEKRKIKKRLDLNHSMDHRLFGIIVILFGIGVGLSAVPAFILLPWMCGVALIVTAILAVWGGNGAITSEDHLMKVSQIADLEDKLIDLDAECSDAIEYSYKELSEPKEVE